MDLIYLKQRHETSLERAKSATNDVARASHASLASLYAEWIEQLQDEAVGRPTSGKFPLRRN